MPVLCTLLPFDAERLSGSEVQANVQVNYRTQEIKFTFDSGISTSINVHHCNYAFTSLLGLPFCKLVALMDDSVPVAIRIYLQKDAISQDHEISKWCSTDFMSFESLLADVIRNTAYLIEPQPRKKSAHACVNLDVIMSVQVAEGLHYSIVDKTFMRQAQQSFSVVFRHTLVVCTITDHWITDIVHQIFKKRGPKLIVTKHSDKWQRVLQDLDKPFMHLRSVGLPANVFLLAPDMVVVADPVDIAANEQSEIKMCEMIRTAFDILNEEERSVHQIQRFVDHHLATKLPTFDLPLQHFTFSTVVLDDMDCSEIQAADVISAFDDASVLQVFWSDRPKPEGLSLLQKSVALRRKSESIIHRLSGLMDFHTQIVPISKKILRKFKVMGHLVRNGPTEIRIAKTFGESLVPVTNAIERFSGLSRTRASCSKSIRHHFDRLQISFAAFVSKSSATPINTNFVLDALEREPSCSICFDALEQFYFTICGHVYCSECYKFHFQVAFSGNASKDCASCRCPLVFGDIFNVDCEAKNVAATTMREQQVNSFLGSLRSADSAVVWPAKSSAAKHIVIKDLTLDITHNLLRDYWQRDMSINVHVFYSAEEEGLFKAFTKTLST